MSQYNDWLELVGTLKLSHAESRAGWLRNIAVPYGFHTVVTQLGATVILIAAGAMVYTGKTIEQYRAKASKSRWREMLFMYRMQW